MLVYRVSDGKCVYQITDNIVNLDRIKAISKNMTYFLSEENGPKSYAIEWDYK